MLLGDTAHFRMEIYIRNGAALQRSRLDRFLRRPMRNAAEGTAGLPVVYGITACEISMSDQP